MKILFLIPYPLHSAASQRFRFEQYLEFVKEEGHAIEIRSFIEFATWEKLYSEGNALLKILGVLGGYIKRCIHLKQAISSDIVFIHREAAPLGPPVFEWMISKILQKKIIYDFDDAIWIPNTSLENSKVSKLKWHSKVDSICKWSWRISCGNTYLAEYAKQFNRNVVLNPTTIDQRYHAPGKTNESKPLTIGWTGTHSTLKYLEAVIPIISQLEGNYDFKFRVISDKAPEFELESMEFVKWRLESEIDDLNDIDIGLMPLPDDPWSKGKCGFKALQYMALEIPALVSPVGINKEIVEDAIQGYHCSTSQDWKNSIEKLLVSEPLRKKMGQAGRKKVIEGYSVKSNTQNFLSLFD
ncbi:MAG: glycosyltransferase family 4 protein [Cyclobacteriaceae bacterium]